MESPDTRLSRGDVLMYLAEADCHRARAAALAGVSLRTFQRAMRRWRVQAPRASARLDAERVRLARALLEKHTGKQVAAMLGVHPQTVGKLRRRDTWMWVR